MMQSEAKLGGAGLRGYEPNEVTAATSVLQSMPDRLNYIRTISESFPLLGGVPRLDDKPLVISPPTYTRSGCLQLATLRLATVAAIYCVV